MLRSIATILDESLFPQAMSLYRMRLAGRLINRHVGSAPAFNRLHVPFTGKTATLDAVDASIQAALKAEVKR